jgi:hypothetical protein
MPRGGKRLGAGRKPHTRRERWLGGNAGHHPLVVVPGGKATASAVVDEPVAQPDVLKDAEAAYWKLWEPLATRRGMLHSDTVPGFVLLCQWAARADAMWECIQGRGYEQEKVTIDGAGQEHREYKANSLLSQWRGLTARVEQAMARYGLTADGKVPTGAEAGDTEDEQLARILAVK